MRCASLNKAGHDGQAGGSGEVVGQPASGQRTDRHTIQGRDGGREGARQAVSRGAGELGGGRGSRGAGGRAVHQA